MGAWRSKRDIVSFRFVSRMRARGAEQARVWAVAVTSAVFLGGPRGTTVSERCSGPVHRRSMKVTLGIPSGSCSSTRRNRTVRTLSTARSRSAACSFHCPAPPSGGSLMCAIKVKPGRETPSDSRHRPESGAQERRPRSRACPCGISRQPAAAIE